MKLHHPANGLHLTNKSMDRRVGGLAYANTAASSVITGATEAETVFDKYYTIPANALQAGSVIRVRAQGLHSATTGAETHTIALKIGSVTVASKTLVDPADNDMFYFDAHIIVRTIGATGTIVAGGVQMAAGQSGAGTASPFRLASTTLDTTAANILGIYIDRQAGATDSDSAILNILTVEII